MKGKVIFLVFSFFFFSCIKSRSKADFSQSVIYSESYSENMTDFSQAIINAQKEAIKIAFETFADDTQSTSLNFFMDNYGFYIHKYKILDKKIENNRAKVSIKAYFLTDKFILALKRENIIFQNVLPKIAVYPTFYSTYDKAMEKFRTAFAGLNYPEFYFFDKKFDMESENKMFDYIVLSDIYSYSLNSLPEVSSDVIPVVSSGTFRIWASEGMVLIGSFDLIENMVGNNFNDTAGLTLISLGTKAKEKIINLINEKEKKKRRVSLIFSNVKEINSLLKIKKVIATLPISKFYLNSFYDKQAIFTIEAGKNSNEEISSFVLRADFTPLQVDYIDKNEIKFSLI